MTANQTTVFVTEQALLARIKLNQKGKLMLESSNAMRLSILLTAFEQGHTDEALLEKYSTLQVEDLAAARLHARKLASDGKVELPHTQKAKIIPMPVANKQKSESEPPKSTPMQSAKPLQTDPFCYKDKLNLTERTTNFGVEILKLYNTLPQTTPAQFLGDQVLRSGASVGAHCREAVFTRTQSEFVSKISVGLQELEESKHWFQLLVEGGMVEASRLAALRQEADEITAILIATVNLTKTRPGEK